MAVSPEPRSRRRRYVRERPEGPVALTPERLGHLRVIARFGMTTVRHLALLAGVSERSARRSMRVCFDAGWVAVVPLPRTALAPTGAVDDASLAWGSGPNVWTLTRAGAKLLQELGLEEQPMVLAGRYGPRNCQFLTHELAIRDVRVWFERCARRHPGHQLEIWHDGAAAAIDLKRSQPPRVVRPDAWLRYRLGPSVLVGMLEVDRGTERGARRWGQKIEAYQELVQGGRLREVTGYTRARVLTVTLDERRRDHLAQFVGEHASEGLAEHFWFAAQSVLTTPDVHAVGWRRVGAAELLPLLPAERCSLPLGEAP
jgi:hypothetical protein